MQCRDTKLLIEAWWDRHLPPDLAEQVERHLEMCPDCRTEYGPTTQLLNHPEPVDVPEGLRERIMAAVEPLPILNVTPFPKRAYVRWWPEVLQAPWAGALAACLTFAFLTWVSSSIPHRHFSTERSPLTDGAAPSPLVLATWAGALPLPGQLGALPAVARAAVFEEVLQGRAAPPEEFVRSRILDQDLPPLDPPPGIPEIPIIVGLSTLGA